MSKTVLQRRARRQAERTAVLEQARQTLEADWRYGGAWLFGSQGRGGEDDFSDLDLFAVVEDAPIAIVSAERHPEVTRFGAAHPRSRWTWTVTDCQNRPYVVQ